MFFLQVPDSSWLFYFHKASSTNSACRVELAGAGLRSHAARMLTRAALAAVTLVLRECRGLLMRIFKKKWGRGQPRKSGGLVHSPCGCNGQSQEFHRPLPRGWQQGSQGLDWHSVWDAGVTVPGGGFTDCRYTYFCHCPWVLHSLGSVSGPLVLTWLPGFSSVAFHVDSEHLRLLTRWLLHGPLYPLEPTDD